MNVSDVLTSALGMLGVLREGESVSAEQGQDGLVVFNNCVSSWREDGIDLPLPSMSDTTTSFQLNEGDALTLKCLIAVNLQPYYPGRNLNPVVIKNADDGYTRWMRNAIHRSEKPSSMSHLPGPKCAVWNVQSDSF